MKQRKTALLVVIIVIFAVVLGILFALYSRQAGERDQLNDRLDRAQTILPGLAANKESLEDQVAQAQSSLNTSWARFPESVDSIEYDDDLLEIADDCNVELRNLTASKPTNKTVGTVTYSVSSFTVAVAGGIDDILEFIYAIRTGDDFRLPWSAEVNGVNMNVAGGTASINLIIYGYKGG